VNRYFPTDVDVASDLEELQRNLLAALEGGGKPPSPAATE